MSGTTVINSLLSAASAVTALVPAASILTGPQLPVSTALPAILVRKIDGDERLTVAMDEPGRFTEQRIQVSAYAADYDSVQAILAQVRDACSPHRGTVAGVAVDSVTPAGEGPDLSDPDAGIFEQSRDFIVRFTA